MASIRALLFFALLFVALSFSMGGHIIVHLLINFANQKPNNSLIFIAVHTFLFFLVPLTYILGIIFLVFHLAIPQSTFFMKHFTKAFLILASITCLVPVSLMVHITFTKAVVPNTLKIMFIGAAVAAAMVTVYKTNDNPFKRYFNSAGQTVGSFVPAFPALCLSMGTFLLIDNDPVSIHLFLFSLNCINFVFAMVLLFLYISVPKDGSQTSIPVVLVKRVVNTVSKLSLIISWLISFYMMDALLIRDR